MNNILPEFNRTVYENSNRKLTEWFPHNANAITGRIPSTLEILITKENSDRNYIENILPKLEPNKRHVSPRVVENLEQSELSVHKRGDSPIAVINYVQPPPTIKNYSIRAKDKFNNTFVVRLINVLPRSIDLFIQKSTAITSSVVNANSNCFRSISGQSSGLGKVDCGPDELMMLLLSTMKRVSITVTGRQEIKTFSFQSGKLIGLEIELDGNKLTCMRVLPDSQASEYAKELVGGEIVSINNIRVINIEEFRNAIIYVQSNYPVVKIQVAIYKGGKQILDDLQSSVKSQDVTSVLSNLFLNGRTMNKNINLDTDDEEEEEDDIESSAKEKPVVNANHSVASSITQQDYDNDESFERQMDTDEVLELVNLNRYGSSETNSKLDTKRPTLNSQEQTEEGKQYFDDGDNNGLIYVNRHGYDAKSDTKYEANQGGDDKIYFDSEGDEKEQLLANRTESKLSFENHSKLIFDPSDINEDIIIPEAEENPENGKSEDSSWDYATSYDAAVIPFTTLVCVPHHLAKSQGWGASKKYIQFSNHSTMWKMEVYWIDSQGVFNLRNELEIGKAHYELCSADQVWALVTTYKSKPGNHSPTSETQTSKINDGMEYESPSILLIRPCKTSLVGNSCTSILWSPWNGITMTKRSLAIKKEMKDNNSEKKLKFTRYSMEVSPHIHIQVLDSNIKKLKSHNSFDDELLAQSKTIDKIKLPQWPKRKSGKHG